MGPLVEGVVVTGTETGVPVEGNTVGSMEGEVAGLCVKGD